ncbi:MBL fold metallo-hydrolase [Candidatus Berkelbacteria bacterium]|nr:MBL fold metallo-hydrolase [Candidatus Berkelbacteria bacterium]
MRTGQYKNSIITALGHAGFLIEFPDLNLSFAFDPYDLQEIEKTVDFVFVSHHHFDHCDPASIKKLMSEKTKIIAPENCRDELEEFNDAVVITDGVEKQTFGALTFWAIPAYNINKFRTPSEVFHPRSLGGLGFIVEIASSSGKNVRFYHAGDTDFIEEIKELKKIDVAFLPISGTFVMTLQEALEAAKAIQPDIVIPMHFGKLLGSSADAVRYQNLLRGQVETMVLTTTE